MWNGLSTTKGSPNKINLEYRLLLLKKDNSTWKIDKGFGWTSPKANNSHDQLHVSLPIGTWTTTNRNKGSYSSRKVWSAIAKVDTSSEDGNDDKDVLSNLKIHMKAKDSGDGYIAEFFGSMGSWSGSSTKEGYQNTDKYYDSTSGWKTISSPIQLGDSLRRWYEHQDGKNLKWMTCGQWVGGEGQSEWDETMKEMCYSSS